MKELRFHGEVIVTGENSLDHLKKIESQKTMIITGKGSMFKNGTIDRITAILGDKGIASEIYSGVKANPTSED